MISEGNVILRLGLRAIHRQWDLESGTLHGVGHLFADNHIAGVVVAGQGTVRPAMGLALNSSWCKLVFVGGISIITPFTLVVAGLLDIGQNSVGLLATSPASTSIACRCVVLFTAGGISFIGLLLAGHHSSGLVSTRPASTMFGRLLLPVIVCGIRLIAIGDGIRISCWDHPLCFVLECAEPKCLLGPVKLLPMSYIVEKLDNVGFLHRS
jgi:hypothetical protein